MKSICGINCNQCNAKDDCSGCTNTNGCPFGTECFIARYIRLGGMDNYLSFKKILIEEINALNVDGMEKVTELYPLAGEFINLEYPLPDGSKTKMLNDEEMYLGTQVHNLFDDKKTCFGIVARENFILISTYGIDGINPEIVIYKKR